ncbi:MAG: hypothetical protein V4540_17935 [Pseudomonadota bacterium]
MPDILSSSDFWKFALPLLGAVVAWFTNEWRKRVADQYQRKEANYKELVRSLRGFYVGAANADELKLEFLNQLNISWLYCPDEVIQKGYAFLETVHAREAKSDEEKQLAFGAFVAAIRKDLLSRSLVHRTQLSAADFKHFSVHRPAPEG